MSVRTKAILALVSFLAGMALLIAQRLAPASILFIVTALLYFSAKRQQ
jgi:hypothetical protein